MPARRRLRFPFVAHAFNTEALTWQSPLIDLKYIKYEMGAQLAEANLLVLDDIITHATGFPTLRRVAEEWTRLLQSPSLHTCKKKNDNDDDEYLPRPFNRMAFNALADLLDYAVETRATRHGPVRAGLHRFERERPGDHAVREFLVTDFNEHEGFNVGKHPLTKAARSCPCKLTRQSCDNCPDCVWVPARGNRPPGCVPRALVENPDDAEAHRRTAPGEWHAHNDATVLEAETGPLGPRVHAPGEAGFMRKVHPRGAPEARQRRRQRRGTGHA